MSLLQATTQNRFCRFAHPEESLRNNNEDSVRARIASSIVVVSVAVPAAVVATADCLCVSTTHPDAAIFSAAQHYNTAHIV